MGVIQGQKLDLNTCTVTKFERDVLGGQCPAKQCPLSYLKNLNWINVKLFWGGIIS